MMQLRHLWMVVSLVVALFATLLGLTRVPPLWWDEGWNLALARNWVETGHYGQLLLGEPAPPGLAGSFEVVAPIALSFRLLGVGVWQGRLVGVLYTLGSFFLMFILARKLFNRKIAWATIGVLLFLIPHPMVNPLLVGRQVLGDIPVVFYLLAGYLFFLAAWSRSLWFLLGTGLFWGIALRLKLQTLPFWAAGVLVPLVFALLKKNWRTASRLTVAALGSWIAFQLLVSVQNFVLHGQTLPQPELPGYYRFIAVVTDLGIRSAALQLALIVGLPVLLGLGYSGWITLRDYKTMDITDGVELVRLSLLALSGSWVLWYMLLSNGGDRYLAPPSFLSAVFVAVLLADFSAQFNLRETVSRGAAFIRLKKVNLSGAKALTAILISLVFTGMTLVVIYLSVRTADHSVAQLARDINGQTSSDAVIEILRQRTVFFPGSPVSFPPGSVAPSLSPQISIGPHPANSL